MDIRWWLSGSFFFLICLVVYVDSFLLLQTNQHSHQDMGKNIKSQFRRRAIKFSSFPLYTHRKSNALTGRFPPHQSLNRGLRMHRCWQLTAINSTVILGGRFSSNASHFLLSDGKTELHRSGPSPDRHRKVQTRFISARFTWSQMEGAQCDGAQTEERDCGTKQGGKIKGKDQYRLTITPVSAWGNGHPYCISARRWFSLKWWSENPTNASDILTQPNRAATTEMSQGLTDQLAQMLQRTPT